MTGSPVFLCLRWRSGGPHVRPGVAEPAGPSRAAIANRGKAHSPRDESGRPALCQGSLMRRGD